MLVVTVMSTVAANRPKPEKTILDTRVAERHPHTVATEIKAASNTSNPKVARM